MASLIEVRNLCKKYGDFVAVDDISLSIVEGEFLTFLGSSGSGKTTTLRLIAGLEQLTSGQVLYRGRDISGAPTRLRDMRMVFQDYALFPHLNVFDNIAFGLRLKITRGKYDSTTTRNLVQEHLEFVQLAGQGGKFPHQLSGGQKQRVALARALVSDPPVVLFDEPLGSLDASLRKSMQFELKRIHERLGKTFIYVTHDQEEAMAMSDRIVVMKNARILQVDTPEKLYTEPATKAVAQFVGAANVLAGCVLHGDADRLTVAVGQDRLSAAAGGHSWMAGDDVAIVLRSEDIRLAPAGAAAADAGLRGTVAGRLFLGKTIEYQIDLGERQPMLTVTCNHAAAIHPVGAQVVATADPDAVRVLAE